MFAMALDSVIASPDPAAAIEAWPRIRPSIRAVAPGLTYYQSPAAPAAHAGRSRAALASPGQRQAARAAAAPSAAGSIRPGRGRFAINLERLRWLPHSMPADRVWVIPRGAQLVLYRANKPAFTTRARRRRDRQADAGSASHDQQRAVQSGRGMCPARSRRKRSTPSSIRTPITWR